MKGRLLRCGDAAVLVEVAGTPEVLALHGALSGDPPSGVVDLVPAARTLLVQVRAGEALGPVRDHVAAVAERTTAGSLPAPSGEPLVVPTVYDGADLDEVADLTGLSAHEVVQAHTGTPWRVAFGGFVPGFAYLVGEDRRLDVPRRAGPRTRVPAGAVGLAGVFSGVYPRESPGGWQLIGRTDVRLWDERRDPPALLTQGRAVRFRQVGP